MGLDIRWPIGLMFSLVGALLIVQGIITGSDTAMYQRSLGININLIWGAVLLIFGGVMTYFAWRATKQPGSPNKR
jgi:protein-S-isoprenylcysteine O-methyltransferase Ste14